MVRLSNRLSTFALAAGLATALAGPAFAQAVPAVPDAGVEVGTPAGEAGPAVGADAGVSTQELVTADDLAANLSTWAGASADVAAITEGTTINIVVLSSLEGGATSTALSDARTANAALLTELHAAVTANATLLARLEAEGYTASDVIAVQAQGDGSVTVYVDDSEDAASANADVDAEADAGASTETPPPTSN